MTNPLDTDRLQSWAVDMVRELVRDSLSPLFFCHTKRLTTPPRRTVTPMRLAARWIMNRFASGTRRIDARKGNSA